MSGKYHYTPEKMDTKYLMLYGVVVDGVFILQFLLAAFCVSIHRRWFSSADAAAREPFDEQIYALRMIQVFCGKKKMVFITLAGVNGHIDEGCCGVRSTVLFVLFMLLFA